MRSLYATAFFQTYLNGQANYAAFLTPEYSAANLASTVEAFIPIESLTLDFNSDIFIDVKDIDALVAEIAAETHSVAFDLSGDGVVDTSDLSVWLSRAAAHNGFGDAYLSGDSDLDGDVDAADLNSLALNWQQDVALWSDGDFNADGQIGAADLNELALNWREAIAATAPATATVPEPSTTSLFLLGVAMFSAYRTSRIKCL